MPLRFTDTDDMLLPAIYRMDGTAGAHGRPFPIRFECRDGYFLTAIADVGVTVEGRHYGDSAWIDIVASPIDVSAYAPGTEDFEIRLTPATADEYEVRLLLTENP
jgi:hypothetical protein